MLRKRRTAHKFSEKRRTTDVLINEKVDFSGLMLSSQVLEGLKSAGFEKPSPIQLEAIPRGRCGLDMIAQAKSGTGKTCVFSVIALESINLEVESAQVLVLAPTREIAVQIKDVIYSIGQHFKGLQTHEFIGGMPLEGDKNRLKKCHIAIGTPGRIKHLIESKLLQTTSIRLFILDEADKLLDESFQEQINWIYSTLPSSKQVLALSATYPEYLAEQLKNYMKDPQFVRLNAVDPALEGICHYFSVVPSHQLPHKIFDEKVKQLQLLLAKLSFHQCLIFLNYHVRAKALNDILAKKGWPSTYISGNQAQNERLNAMAKLKEFKCRILISTDLTSRGIDAERVNLVINMDLPYDSETYLHRVGRAGRFGSYGVAVNFVAEGEELKNLKKMEDSCAVTITPLPDDFSKLLSHKMTQEKKCEVISLTNLESESVVDEISGNDVTNAKQTGEICKTESGYSEKVHDGKHESSVIKKDDEIDQEKTKEDVITDLKDGIERLSTRNKIEANIDDVELKQGAEKMVENTEEARIIANEDLTREHLKNMEDEGITKRNIEALKEIEYGNMVVNSREDSNNVEDIKKIESKELIMNDTVKERLTEQTLTVTESELEDKMVFGEEKIIERENPEQEKIFEQEIVQERRVIEYEYTDNKEDNTESERCLSQKETIGRIDVESDKNDLEVLKKLKINGLEEEKQEEKDDMTRNIKNDNNTHMTNSNLECTDSSSSESINSSESTSTDESDDPVIFRKREYEFSSSEETESCDSHVPISCKDFENALEDHLKDSVDFSQNDLKNNSQTLRIVNDDHPVGTSNNEVYSNECQSLSTQVYHNACHPSPNSFSELSRSQMIQGRNNPQPKKNVEYSAEQQSNTADGKNYLSETGEIYSNEHKRHFGTNNEPNSRQTEFYGATSDDVREYMAVLPEDWKNIWYRVYDRQTSFLMKYTAFCQQNF